MSVKVLLWVILLTFTPTLELRASIPYAILVAKWPAFYAAAVATLANTALAPLVWVFVHRIMPIFLQVAWIERIYSRVVDRNAAKLQDKVDRYGVLGLALFIGVPFPGTGVYSGCLAAWALKFRFRDYLLASFLGCLIAAVAVTVVVASGNEAFHFLYKDLAAH
jgi:uncharacterized membrane protein